LTRNFFSYSVIVRHTFGWVLNKKEEDLTISDFDLANMGNLSVMIGSYTILMLVKGFFNFYQNVGCSACFMVVFSLFSKV